MRVPEALQNPHDVVWWTPEIPETQNNSGVPDILALSSTTGAGTPYGWGVRVRFGPHTMLVKPSRSPNGFTAGTLRWTMEPADTYAGLPPLAFGDPPRYNRTSARDPLARQLEVHLTGRGPAGGGMVRGWYVYMIHRLRPTTAENPRHATRTNGFYGPWPPYGSSDTGYVGGVPVFRVKTGTWSMPSLSVSVEELEWKRRAEGAVRAPWLAPNPAYEVTKEGEEEDEG